VTTDTRARLVAAAIELLDRGGPAAVTLREVGQLAGVSHNAPYRHFADKEDLLAAIAAQEMRGRSDLMGRLIGEHPPIEALRTLARAYVAWARAKPERFKLSFGAWNRGSDELRRAAADARAQLISIVQAAQARSELPPGDPERLAALMMALVHGAVGQALSGHLAAGDKGHADPEDLVDDLLGYLIQSAGRG
jgi:AcrR family transcriptional regulator